LTPKKKKDSLNTVSAASPLSLGASRLFFGDDESAIIGDSDSFGSGFSQPFADRSGDSYPFGTGSPEPLADNNEQSALVEISDNPSNDDENFDFSATISQIELQQANHLPEYFELLQWNASSFARISPRCYVLQDWDPRTKMLKVTLLFF